MNLLRPLACWLGAAAAALVLVAAAPARAEEDVVRWTRSPDLVPWETMTTSGDPDRIPALDREQLRERRIQIHAFLDRGGLSAEERATALVELGDLFRDEARMVLTEDAADPLRVPLRTTPAWLQLEFAQKQYRQAADTGVDAIDRDGRLTLLTTVIARRLGESDGMDNASRIIREYRGTPYVEMAKLAVGDHLFAMGRLDDARSTYRSVRQRRDPELSAYADYRLASIYARTGDPDKARDILESLLQDKAPGPFPEMLRDAARSALANHRAAAGGLPELLPWLHGACATFDDACNRELRHAAAETYAERGRERADAWLRTVDAAPPVAGDLDTRQRLVAAMLDESVGADALLELAEETCAPERAMCRAEMAHAVAAFYAEIGDPDGTWLQDYVRLPRLSDRPDVQKLTARIARSPRPPAEELADIEALCRDDARCTQRMHTHLRIVWGRLSRLHDAAWLHFVDEGIPVPGPPDIELRVRELVRARARAPEMLGELEPLCAGASACEDELFELLVGYYAAVGQEREASWLIALKTLPELPIPAERRAVLREAALSGVDGRQMLAKMLQTCQPLEPRCFASSRVAAEVFLRGAARHGDAVDVADLGVLTTRTLDPAVFPTMVRITLDDGTAIQGLAAIERACEGRPGPCAIDARATLADWYESQSRFADARTVKRIDAPPDLGEWSRLAPSFLRVARTAPSGREAAARVVGLCPSTEPACADTLLDALGLWYESQGRPSDAEQVRQR